MLNDWTDLELEMAYRQLEIVDGPSDPAAVASYDQQRHYKQQFEVGDKLKMVNRKGESLGDFVVREVYCDELSGWFSYKVGYPPDKSIWVNATGLTKVDATNL